MLRYVALLKQATEVINKLAEETATMNHRITQQQNDFESMNVRLTKQRDALAEIDVDLKSRAVAFEAGLRKIRESAEADRRDAKKALEDANRELESAKKERGIAESVRQSAEVSKKEMATVSTIKQKMRL